MVRSKIKKIGLIRETSFKKKKNFRERVGMGTNDSKGKSYTKSKARLSNYENLLSQKSKETEEKLELYIPPGP